MEIAMTDSKIEQLYREVLLDHYSSPRNAKLCDNPTSEATGHNPLCGDDVDLTLIVNKEGKIEAIGTRTQGCSICVASGSIMSEEIEGQKTEWVEAFIDKVRAMLKGDGPPVESESGDLQALEGVRKFPVRIKCALLPWMTLEQALKEHRGSSNAKQPAKTE